MEKPSVTLRHDTYYLLGGFMLLMTVLLFVMSLVLPVAQQPGQPSVWWAVIPLLICSVACFWGGTFTETLDENGIYIKRPFYSQRYPWNDVTKVSIRVVQQYKCKGPEFSLSIKNRKMRLSLAYTKRAMSCITYYYGQPDEDHWGKPPSLM